MSSLGFMSRIPIISHSEWTVLFRIYLQADKLKIFLCTMPSKFTLYLTSKLLFHPTQIETHIQIVSAEFPYELVINYDNSVKHQKGGEFVVFSCVTGSVCSPLKIVGTIKPIIELR